MNAAMLHDSTLTLKWELPETAMASKLAAVRAETSPDGAAMSAKSSMPCILSGQQFDFDCIEFATSTSSPHFVKVVSFYCRSKSSNEANEDEVQAHHEIYRKEVKVKL